MIKQAFDQFPEEPWVTAVQVATVWTNPDSARDMDTPATTNPTDIDQWVKNQTYEKRVALCDESRVQTQLLYGEAVIVTELKGDWAKVIIPTQPSHKDKRGYPGWVPFKQLKKIPKHDWQRDQTAVINDQFAWLETENGDHFVKISYQTQLPVRAEHTNRVEVATPHGPLFLNKQAVTLFTTTLGIKRQDGQALIRSGEQFLGLDYFWGGMSAFGYDCSGFSYVMHKANGYQIPRDAGDQAASGEKVPYDQSLPGDLLFFAYQQGKGALHHVGFNYGDGKMLHSPKTGKRIEIIDLKGTVYEEELCSVARYWRETGETG